MTNTKGAPLEVNQDNAQPNAKPNLKETLAKAQIDSNIDKDELQNIMDRFEEEREELIDDSKTKIETLIKDVSEKMLKDWISVDFSDTKSIDFINKVFVKIGQTKPLDVANFKHWNITKCVITWDLTELKVYEEWNMWIRVWYVKEWMYVPNYSFLQDRNKTWNDDKVVIKWMTVDNEIKYDLQKLLPKVRITAVAIENMKEELSSINDTKKIEEINDKIKAEEKKLNELLSKITTDSDKNTLQLEIANVKKSFVEAKEEAAAETERIKATEAAEKAKTVNITLNDDCLNVDWITPYTKINFKKHFKEINILNFWKIEDAKLRENFIVALNNPTKGNVEWIQTKIWFTWAWVDWKFWDKTMDKLRTFVNKTDK